jgi:hypothetical protein
MDVFQAREREGGGVTPVKGALIEIPRPPPTHKHRPPILSNIIVGTISVGYFAKWWLGRKKHKDLVWGDK